MKNVMKVLSYLLVAVLASVITLLAVVPGVTPAPTKLDELGDLIEERFIGESDRTAMDDAAAEAMIASLGDRWSHYIPAAEYAAYMDQMNNSYVGIGVTIQVLEDEGGFKVTKVHDGSPAREAGIRPGDIIVGVEGQDATAMDIREVQNMVRGEPESEVSLTVRRNGEDLTLFVTRREIQTAVAEARMLEDHIGLIRIVNFDNRCSDETIGAIEQMISQGAESLIFDVRFNPGGYKHELCDVLDYLLPEGPLFRSLDYQGREEVDESDEKFLDIPMAVLVNGESYSAAEFFGAALREYDAAFLVGEQTVGKGYFQTTIRLNDGSAVGLSVGKYFTPKGVSLAGVGLTPDIVVPVDEETAGMIYAGLLDPEKDPQIRAAADALKEK